MIFRVLKCFCDSGVSHEQAVLKLVTSEIASRILLKGESSYVLNSSFCVVSRCLTHFIHFCPSISHKSLSSFQNSGFMLMRFPSLRANASFASLNI